MVVMDGCAVGSTTRRLEEARGLDRGQWQSMNFFCLVGAKCGVSFCNLYQIIQKRLRAIFYFENILKFEHG